MNLISDDEAFAVTAVKKKKRSVFSHQQKLLRHTSLRAIHWINLCQSKVEIQTIETDD